MVLASLSFSLVFTVYQSGSFLVQQSSEHLSIARCHRCSSEKVPTSQCREFVSSSQMQTGSGRLPTSRTGRSSLRISDLYRCMLSLNVTNVKNAKVIYCDHTCLRRCPSRNLEDTLATCLLTDRASAGFGGGTSDCYQARSCNSI